MLFYYILKGICQNLTPLVFSLNEQASIHLSFKQNQKFEMNKIVKFVNLSQDIIAKFLDLSQ